MQLFGQNILARESVQKSVGRSWQVFPFTMWSSLAFGPDVVSGDGDAWGTENKTQSYMKSTCKRWKISMIIQNLIVG